MKNVKSVKQADGKRLNVQKRLLLVNIDELHRDYKKKLTSDGLRAFGLSVFASLRPPNVITVGSSGTHSVCVCVYHQNVKLRLAAIHIIDERYYFMDKLVCNVYNKVYQLFFKLLFSKFYIFSFFIIGLYDDTLRILSWDGNFAPISQ